jgi:hypothetical protein
MPFQTSISPPPHCDTLEGYTQIPGIMESYWCEKKNSIIEIMKNPGKFNPALTPCLKAECALWRNGECTQIHKAGKPEKPQVFSN